MKKLTVTIGDPSPTIHEGASPGIRRVTIDLTEAQQAALELKVTSEIDGRPIRESIRDIFFE